MNLEERFLMEVRKFATDPDFVLGMRTCIRTEEERLAFLKAVKDGEIVDYDDAMAYSLDVADAHGEEEEKERGKFYKKKETDVIWWLTKLEDFGGWWFSFDKTHTFNVYQDYPDKLTPRQKEIFDRENPHLRDYFMDKRAQQRRG